MTPEISDNVCSDKQKSGFNWLDLDEGSFTEYSEFSFQGFSCSSKNGKKVRTVLSFPSMLMASRQGTKKLTVTKKQGSKHITGKISKQFGSLQMSRRGKNGFSANSFHVSTSRDVDVVFLYEMPDGSTCKQTVPCTANGTDVVNRQCGGAVSVAWSIAEYSEIEETEIIFDNIAFDCNPAKPPKFSTEKDTDKGSTQAPPPPSSSSLALTDIVGTSGWPKFPPVQTSQPGSSQSIPDPKTGPQTDPADLTCSPSTIHTNQTITTCAVGGDGDCPDDKKTTTTTEIVTTTQTTGTDNNNNASDENTDDGNGNKGKDESCSASPPVWASSSAAPSSTPAQSSEQISSSKPAGPSSPPAFPIMTTESSTPAQSSTEASSNTPPETDTPKETNTPTDQPKDDNSGTGVAANCPPVLPKCINTWLPEDCKDNTDLSCYCREEKTTSKIIECVTAWGTDKEVQAALSYFTGLCSDHVEENPGIVTDVPSSVTLTPPPPASSETDTATPPPNEEGGNNSGKDKGRPSSNSQQCVTLTVTSSTVIVPQVTFSTTTNAAGETSVDLYEPTPTPEETTIESVGGAPPITSVPAFPPAEGNWEEPSETETPSPEPTEESSVGSAPPGPEITGPAVTPDEEEETIDPPTEDNNQGENNEPPNTITTDDAEGGEPETSTPSTPNAPEETETETQQTTLTTTTSSTATTNPTTSILTDDDATDVPSPSDTLFSDTAAAGFAIRRAFLAGVVGAVGLVVA